MCVCVFMLVQEEKFVLIEPNLTDTNYDSDVEFSVLIEIILMLFYL